MKTPPFVYSRAEFSRGICSHEEYWGQYVDEAQITMAVDHIGSGILQASTAGDFGDISLARWDSCPLSQHAYTKLVQNEGCISLTAREAITKIAAHQYLMRRLNGN